MWPIESQGHRKSSREDTTMRTEEETEPLKGKVKEEETHTIEREQKK